MKSLRFESWRAILFTLLILALSLAGVNVATAINSVGHDVVEELQFVFTPVCIGIGRYERVQDPERILVFDTCRGRYYLLEAAQWELWLPAIPDIPPTAKERENWDEIS